MNLWTWNQDMLSLIFKVSAFFLWLRHYGKAAGCRSLTRRFQKRRLVHASRVISHRRSFDFWCLEDMCAEIKGILHKFRKFWWDKIHIDYKFWKNTENVRRKKNRKKKRWWWWWSSSHSSISTSTYSSFRLAMPNLRILSFFQSQTFGAWAANEENYRHEIMDSIKRNVWCLVP